MIDGLNPYQAYKDSGVPWIGQVPEHWGTSPLKRSVGINAKVLDESTAADTSLKYIYIGAVCDGRLVRAPQLITFANAPSRARRIIRSGDTIFSTVRPYLKAVLFVEEADRNLICSTGFAVLSPKGNFIPRFLYYLARSETFIDRVTADSVGIAYPAVAETRLASIAIPLPLLSDQSCIVRLLDNAERKIGRYIAAKRKLIRLLEEEKQAIIHRAVTRGLDPNVRLKPSGIDWLGDIPEHWEVKRNFALFAERRELGRPDLPIFSVSLRSGITPILDGDNCGRRRRLIENLALYQVAFEGDVAYNMMRMWQGAVGTAPYDGLVSPAYVVAAPRMHACADYYVLLFRTGNYKNEINRVSRGIVSDRNRLYWDSFKAMVVPVPPRDEQQRIVASVRSETTDVAKAVGAACREIDLLSEFRTRLISDVVTGRLDVRAAAAALPAEDGENRQAEPDEELPDQDEEPEIEPEQEAA